MKIHSAIRYNLTPYSAKCPKNNLQLNPTGLNQINKQINFRMAKITIPQEVISQRIEEEQKKKIKNSFERLAHPDFSKRDEFFLDKMPYSQFLQLCLKESPTGYNCLEKSSSSGVDYILSRIKKEDIFLFLKKGPEKLTKSSLGNMTPCYSRPITKDMYNRAISSTDADYLLLGDYLKGLKSTRYVEINGQGFMLKDTFDRVLDTLSPEEIFNFYSSKKDGKNNKTHMDDIFEYDCRCAVNIFRKLDEKQKLELIYNSFDLFKKIDRNQAAYIINSSIENEEERLKLYKNLGILYYAPKSIEKAVEIFSKENLAQLFRGTKKADGKNAHAIFGVIKYTQEAEKNSPEKNWTIDKLLKALPPEEFSDIYTDTIIDSESQKVLTILSNIDSTEFIEKICETLPKNALIQILKNSPEILNHFENRTTLYDIMKKIGKTESSNIIEGGAELYDKLAYREFAEQKTFNDINERMQSQEFNNLTKYGQVQALLTLDNYCSSDLSIETIDLLYKFATSDEEVNIEDSIRLLRIYIECMKNKYYEEYIDASESEEIKRIYAAQYALEVLKNQSINQ